jgi:lipase
MNAVSEHRLALTGGDLCWFEWGAAAPDRPSLLLVHATGFHARCWDAIVAALPVGMHVIAPDLRGHGRSYRPVSIGNWAETGDDVVALIDALAPDLRLVVAGHSMGGVCAVYAGAKRPDRCDGLILIDPVIFAPEHYADPAMVIGGDPAEHFVARRRNHWASADEMIARFAARAPYDRWDARVLADYCRWGLVQSADGAGLELACPPLLEASAYLGNAAFNPHRAAAAIRCPVTVLRGRQGERGQTLDFSISPTWAGLAGVFADGHDEHWDECSHFIPMEAPARLAARIALAAGFG